MEIHLIRHPIPDIPAGVCYGQSDIGIIEPASLAADRLRPHLPTNYSLYTSPLRRARLLAEELGTPQPDPRLMEINFGEWEMQPYGDLGGALDDWAKNPMGFRAPGGESVQEMANRALNWLKDLQTQPSVSEKPVVVVAHGGPLRALAGHLLGVPPERWLGLDFACAHTTCLEIKPWGTLLKWFNK